MWKINLIQLLFLLSILLSGFSASASTAPQTLSPGESTSPQGSTSSDEPASDDSTSLDDSTSSDETDPAKKIMKEIRETISRKIKVTISGSVAIEVGKVGSPDDGSLAIAIAMSYPNMSDVDTSQLTTDDGKPLPLYAIVVGKIKGMWVQRQVFPGVTHVTEIPIQISTRILTEQNHAGINQNYVQVDLNGMVDTLQIRINAIKIAQLTPGAARVISNLVIKPIKVRR